MPDSYKPLSNQALHSAVSNVRTVTGAEIGTVIDLNLNWSGTAATIDATSTIDVTGTIRVVGVLLGDD